jgi:hypothetical protein
MIGLPTRGIAASVNVHNVDRSIFCDWIEANVLFLGEEVTGSDLVDILTENNIYKSQGFAWQFVEDVFLILELRSRLVGEGYPLRRTDDGFEVKGEWEDYAPYAFCLMLSLARSHNAWLRENFGADFTHQGELFELLTAESITQSLSGWKVHLTGWTRSRTVAIKQVVSEICSQVNEAAGDVLRWTASTAKEAGARHQILLYGTGL